MIFKLVVVFDSYQNLVSQLLLRYILKIESD
jgi:hypothetical protein